MTTIPLVGIILVNWNGLEDTLECLSSLAQIDCRQHRQQIIVVDNGSQVDPTTHIHEAFPEVHIIKLATNVGFARANNIGIAQALEYGADYVLLLNNDTVVEPAFLSHLLAGARQQPVACVAVPLICFFHDRDRIWFAGATISLRFGIVRHKHFSRCRTAISLQSETSDYATGCCMLIPKAIIRNIGVLDEKFFAYFEDADYGIRVRQAGFKNIFVPESVIWHKESASTRRNLVEGNTSPLKHYLMARNRTRIVFKHGTLPERLMFLFTTELLLSAFFLAAFAARRRWKKAVLYFRGIVHGFTGELDFAGAF